MGDVNVVTKAYLSNNEVFADICNAVIYNGVQVIDPKSLRDEDPTELSVLSVDSRTLKKKKAKTAEKHRDVLKYAAFKSDESLCYMIIGIESQDKISLTMPLRSMTYDAMQYEKQIRQIRRAHEIADANKGIDSKEFLSGFCKEDRLKPVMTIVVYWGEENWIWPLSLHDMMEPCDPRVMKLVQDYKIHLIQPAGMKEEDFAKFHSDFGMVMEYLQAADNGLESMDAFWEHAPAYGDVTADALLVMDACRPTGVKLIDKEEDMSGKVNMAEYSGRVREFLAQYEARGEERGEKHGFARGKDEGRLESIYDFVLAEIIPLEIGVQQSGKSKEEFCAGLKDYQSKKAAEKTDE